MIRTVIFDLGNVCVYFSNEKLMQQMAELLDVSAEFFEESVFSYDRHALFEKGEMTVEDYYQAFIELSGCTRDIEIPDMRYAFCDIFQPNLAIQNLIERLKTQGKRVIALSNINQEHHQFIASMYTTLEYFDDLVLSYEVGANKPESAIYEAALNKAHCSKDECFFTDDTQGHVDAAKHFGFHAEVFTNTENLEKQLIDLKALVI